MEVCCGDVGGEGEAAEDESESEEFMVLLPSQGWSVVCSFVLSLYCAVTHSRAAMISSSQFDGSLRVPNMTFRICSVH